MPTSAGRTTSSIRPMWMRHARSSRRSTFRIGWSRSAELDRLDMRLDAFKVGSMTAGRLAYGRAVRLRTVEASCFHVNVPLRGRTLSRCGTLDPVVTSPRRAAVFVPHRPADMTWDADCEQLCLMVPTRAVELELEHLLGRTGPEPIVFSPALDLSSPAAQSWHDGLQLLAREFERSGGLAAHPLAGRHLERLLLAGLLLGQPNNYSDLLAARVAPAGRGAFGSRRRTSGAAAGAGLVDQRAGQRGIRERKVLARGVPTRNWAAADDVSTSNTAAAGSRRPCLRRTGFGDSSGCRLTLGLPAFGSLRRCLP